MVKAISACALIGPIFSDPIAPLGTRQCSLRPNTLKEPVLTKFQYGSNEDESQVLKGIVFREHIAALLAMRVITPPPSPPLEATTIPLDNFKPRGYHKLASLMGPNPDVAIFRRFGALNMLNLMSLQVELVDLEAQLSDIAREDDTSDDTNRKL